MHRLVFEMDIPLRLEEDVKRLLFFNKQQKKFAEGINYSLNKFGMPEIYQENESLKIKIGNLQDVQTIFALDSRGKNSSVLGAAVFYRVSIEEITILHLFVHEDLAAGGALSDEMITLRLISQVKELGKKLKGVEKISLAYLSDKPESVVPVK